MGVGVGMSDVAGTDWMNTQPRTSLSALRALLTGLASVGSTGLTPGRLRTEPGGDRDPWRWGKRERQTGRDRDRDRQTDRQTDREPIYIERDRQRQRQTDRERHRQRETDKETERQRDRERQRQKESDRDRESTLTLSVTT